ncbi:MAG TPA: Cys-tRNA(Pro) deacylase [Firmicutes bacterium]|nr:Cys-tRNA(Pro) deacylase [Bacillota bacterium]
MAELKTNAVRTLDKNHIPYRLHAYEPGDSVDGVSVAAKLGQDPEKVYKTLVTKGKSGGHHVFVIPVAEELDLKKAARAAGEKAVEMIPVKDLLKTTGYIRGGCSPVGMKKPFPTVIHAAAEDLDAFCVSAGRIGLQIEVKPTQLAELIGAAFEDIIR